MTQNEILNQLKNNEVIKEKSYMKFKRNKIVRGTFIEYYIGEQRIKSNQFDAIRNFIKKDAEASDSSCTVYKLK